MPDWKTMKGCKERKPQICGGEYSMFIVFYFYHNHVHVYSSTTSHQRTLNSGMKVQNNVVYKCYIVNITFILYNYCKQSLFSYKPSTCSPLS